MDMTRMTLTEARDILALAPEWVREAGRENVGHYIGDSIDPGGNAILHPGEDLMETAEKYLDAIDESWPDKGPTSLTVRQIAAYLVVNTAEEAERVYRAAHDLGNQIERDDPRCRVTGIRREPDGACTVHVIDTRTGNLFIVATLEDWQQRKRDAALAAVPHPGDPVPDPVLNVKQAAAHLGLSEKLVRQHIKVGRLRAYRPGRSFKIRKSAVEEFERAAEVTRTHTLDTLESAEAALHEAHVARAEADGHLHDAEAAVRADPSPLNKARVHAETRRYADAQAYWVECDRRVEAARRQVNKAGRSGEVDPS